MDEPLKKPELIIIKSMVHILNHSPVSSLSKEEEFLAYNVYERDFCNFFNMLIDAYIKLEQTSESIRDIYTKLLDKVKIGGGFYFYFVFSNDPMGNQCFTYQSYMESSHLQVTTEERNEIHKFFTDNPIYIENLGAYHTSFKLSENNDQFKPHFTACYN